ncbi:GNAT family N-acetyltransferase [Ferrimonas futtsuensis]|uniref:GNAT family N-acetyltransferase n=1 Tax=Ferrimonas futtsuensis TaxID=364764 RepID=UPI0004215C91|nr:GNAT family N-acetyltransferase [Ferrimonas futtsuensis]
MVHRYLSEEAYWSPGIPRALVDTGIDNALCFGLYHGRQQVGFARLITDYATFGYLADLFILRECRGQGLAKWLVDSLFEMEETQRLRRIMLATVDAHELYRHVGFGPSAHPERLMEIHRPNLYRSLSRSDESSPEF